MAMQIEFGDGCREVCTYTGTINDEYKFSLEVLWLSKKRDYIVKNIVFNDDNDVNFDTKKAEKRIRKLVRGWYYLDK